jgi:hypothetical protein
MYGDGNVEIKLVGDTFDDCAHLSQKNITEDNGMVFIPPLMITGSLKDRERLELRSGRSELCRLFISPDRLVVDCVQVLVLISKLIRQKQRS